MQRWQGRARVLSSDLGGCSFEQEGDNFYVVGADAVRKKLGSSGIGGTLETVAVRDRTVMTRNYIFNNTGDYVSLVLNVKTPPNGGNANSVTVYGTAIGTSTYKQIQKITTLNADVTVNIKGYYHIKLAVTASHSGNVGHSYEATTITTYALSYHRRNHSILILLLLSGRLVLSKSFKFNTDLECRT